MPSDLDNRQRAQPAFPPPAIGDHLDAGGLQRIEHRDVLRHVDLHAEPGNFHREGSEA